MYIFRLRDIDWYPQSEWDLRSVLAKRRALLCEEPIISSKITRLDLWLSEQRELTLEEIGQIWMRMLIVSSIEYGLERDPEQKHSAMTPALSFVMTGASSWLGPVQRHAATCLHWPAF